jgi:hypothetical protein
VSADLTAIAGVSSYFMPVNAALRAFPCSPIYRFQVAHALWITRKCRTTFLRISGGNASILEYLLCID